MGARDWYIAWLATPTEPFDPVAHKRADLPWAELDLTESEGADATSVTIVTARMPSSDLVGKTWAMLSFQHPNGTLYPVARMKRLPVPAGARDGVTTLRFEAGLLPGWKDLRDAGLAELKTQGAYAAILVSPTRQGDPTEILDGHRVIGHFDRVTGEYSTPELLGQGLPSRTFTPDDWVGWESGGGISYESTGEPIAGVQLTISTAWMQLLEGLFEMSGSIADLFPELNLRAPGQPTTVDQLFRYEMAPGEWSPDQVATGLSTPPDVIVGKGLIATLTPDELIAGWPKLGSSVGGQSGYVVVASTIDKASAASFTGLAQPNQPKQAGPVHGSHQRYPDYTKPKNNPDDPTEFALDITYLVAQLVLAFTCRQSREETFSVFVPNGACTDDDAPVRTLTLRCEDPTVDRTTTPWLPATQYAAGDVRRFGWYSWIALKAHKSSTSFRADVDAGNWKVAQTDGSYIGGPSGNTFFPSPGGNATFIAGILKALKIIALSQRRVAVGWDVPFEDVVGMSTAWHARVEADDLDLPGGFAEGKVTSFRVRDRADGDGWPRASIRIASCDGTGAAGAAGGEVRVGYLDEPWDVVAVSGFAVPPPDDPVIGVTASVENNVAEQLAFVQANDYRRGDPVRGDKTKNDPKALLRQVPTRVGFAAAPINGGPPLQHYIPALCSPWQGPRQCVPPSV
ncbi:hypothetical protein [Methylobacterium indicum]|uniref:Uncharacterized protein n=1 Tax=Methylobacterium indicum TaxID=1775910 RepID=A0A8H9C686_9HYPH|nr:hypothetical protein [Methylobacterium indicum]BCM83601.1 hypothetical protein mvi_20620 [Methylobacterium indicum]